MLRTILMIIMVLAVSTPGRLEAQGTPPPRCSASDGQALIDEGRYEHAIREFTCLIDTQPTEVEGYRGRIEAQVLLGKYSDAIRDYTIVTAKVLPVHPDAQATINSGYAARLALDPDNLTALTGASFAFWWDFNYPAAIHMLSDLLDVEPDSVYGNLFRGSSRLLLGVSRAKGEADLAVALALLPDSPDVRFIVADAYTYGFPDPNRALLEATLALLGGLDTPRVHAILGAAYSALGDPLASAGHVQRHIDLVTTELVKTSPLVAGNTVELGLVPGRTYEVPLPVTDGESVSIATSSRDFVDTILVLLAPDGSPVLASDDFKAYFAGFAWIAEATATYRMQVTSFESVSTGKLIVTRKASR